jgi:effector-binding domain-containing protein
MKSLITRRDLFGLLAAALAAVPTQQLMAVEEAEYTVVMEAGDIEVRDYAPAIVAETIINDEFEEAGDLAFRKLFKYIGGNNQAREEIAMTAPVAQEERSEKIAMTAPVGQQKTEEGWAVSFMMPASYSMETVPKPLDPDVVIRQIPAHRAVSIRYSGFWSEEKYREHLEELQAWIRAENHQVTGVPVWARYNAPFTPWFMRRNEILIPVKS